MHLKPPQLKAETWHINVRSIFLFQTEYAKADNSHITVSGLPH